MKNKRNKLSTKLSLVLIASFTIAAILLSTSYVIRHQVINQLFGEAINEDIEVIKNLIKEENLPQLYKEGKLETIKKTTNDIHRERPSVGFFITINEYENKNEFETIDEIVDKPSSSTELIMFDSFYVLYYFERSDNYRDSLVLANLPENQKMELEIYSNKPIEYLNYYLIFSILFAICIFTVIFILLIDQKIKQINHLIKEVWIMKDGTFKKSITHKGNDELSQLANQIDQMRLSFLENENTQKELDEANKELIQRIETNLNTPLFQLEEYLTTLSLINENDKSEEHLLQQSLDTANTINDIGNELFNFFLVHKQNQETRSYSTHQILEELHEQIFNLQTNNYNVTINTQDIQDSLYVTNYSLEYIYQLYFDFITKHTHFKHPISIEILQNINSLEINSTFVNASNQSLLIPSLVDNLIKLQSSKNTITLTLTFIVQN